MSACGLATTLPCWLEVDLDTVAANVGALRRWLGPHPRIAAVVKAQAYGAGAEEMARAALQAGASWLAVARVHEGAELRHAGIRAPILVMNRTELGEAESAVQAGLAVTVDTAELVRELDAVARRLRRRVNVHLKVDTGLHRFGVDPEAALDVAEAISDAPMVSAEALWTHFASADESDTRFTLEQFARFEQVAQHLTDRGYRFPMRHAANSAGTLNLRQTHLDMVRVGITLQGFDPCEAAHPEVGLQPTTSLRARVARIIEVPVGDGVGYGQIWHAERPSRIALVTVGYADGLPRRLSNHGSALVHGQSAPIVGRISMDQTTLDVTDIPNVEVGDVACFFGRDGERTLELGRVAKAADTIPYEILTGIGSRVARVYRGDDTTQRITRLSGTVPVD
jgi:alanine racemase